MRTYLSGNQSAHKPAISMLPQLQSKYSVNFGAIGENKSKYYEFLNRIQSKNHHLQHPFEDPEADIAAGRNSTQQVTFLNLSQMGGPSQGGVINNQPSISSFDYGEMSPVTRKKSTDISQLMLINQNSQDLMTS